MARFRLQRRRSPIGEAVFVAVIAVLPAWLLGHLSGLLIRPLVFAGLQLLVGFVDHELALRQLADLQAAATPNTVVTIYTAQPVVPSWLVLGFLVFASTLIAELIWRAVSHRHAA